MSATPRTWLGQLWHLPRTAMQKLTEKKRLKSEPQSRVKTLPLSFLCPRSDQTISCFLSLPLMICSSARYLNSNDSNWWLSALLEVQLLALSLSWLNMVAFWPFFSQPWKSICVRIFLFPLLCATLGNDTKFGALGLSLALCRFAFFFFFFYDIVKT